MLLCCKTTITPAGFFSARHYGQVGSDHRREQLVFPPNLGFCRLALKHGVPLLPIYVFGENQVFTTYEWGRQTTAKLFNSFGVCVPLVNPLPNRVTLHMMWGEPVEVPGKSEDPEDSEVERVFARISSKLTDLTGFHGTIPYGFWVSTVSVPTAIGGLLLYPYLPHRSSDICFLDYVCVDQTDTARMQQGIRSIGAFLASSKELRVLWSAPYLKRLWCVFELAAFRKLNPQGQIIISPLLSEATVYLMFLWVQLASAAFLAVRTGPNGGDPLRFLMLLVGSFLLLFPTLFHAGSTKHRADKLLQAQLSSFDVTKVECSSEFDKQSIHEAIISWYGSLDAFSNHIRGPFRLEVTELLRTRGSLSPQYIYIATLPIFCLSLEGLLALSKAGAPWQSILGFFLAHVLGLDVLWLPAVANLGAYMTKRGLRVCGRRMMPYSLEFTIVFVLSSILFVAGGFCTVIVSAQSLTTVLVWVLVALVLAFGCWKFCWRV
ncbi:2-acylglycerol O-acyltransferase 2 [Symbiodinium microadriaticum]|uniref:Acyltransferase n=1 Tax=Symbiodinium microadriaticum TaxID=2951 RepID=A0A1Q9F4R7_SYMMI|nr:2-acylglycerol O-acyltransferase 2 [Symbiodinium microadriaticum]CAE7619026.1 MOGAT2 [Symbiodinium microadriaticum]